jgi:hypothetical protein
VIVHRIPQRSPEWFAVRLGKLTASEAKDMMSSGRGSAESTKRRDLRLKKAGERLTGRPDDGGYTNAHMERGVFLEDAARQSYQVHVGALVEEVGFLEHDELAAGCSPDGLVEDGLLELKAPKQATHARYARTDGLIEDYRWQLTHSLWVSGAPWIDIASFDDRYPENAQLIVRRLKATDVSLVEYEEKVREFLREVDLDVASIRGWRVIKGAA